ncbi:TPA: PAS domain S-box protein, partial [Methanosarcina acetivorans]
TYFEQLVEAEARSARELSDFDMEIPMLRPDGQVRWMRLHSHPRRLPDGRTIWDGVQTDITELKQAEEERKKLLREVDEACKRFETVVENSPVGICVWRGPDLVYELANPAYHVFAPGKQFLGKTYAEVWPEAIEPHMSIIRRVMETGEPYYATDVPVPIRRNSNDPLEDRFFNIFYSALPPDTSGRVGVLNITVETTERKRAEEALMKIHKDLEEKIKERTAELEKSYNSLKESERRLSEAQKMAHLGSWDRDIATDEIYWSDEAYRIYGLSPQEFKITYNMFLSYVHPDDRDYVNNTIKKVLYGKPYSIDFRIIAADGVERIVHSQGEVTFDERNKPVRAKGTVQDITEYKKAEEKIQSLANIVESSNDAIITESLDGIITSWNKGAERIYGYSAKEILGKPMSVLEPSILAGEKKELVKLVKQGEVIQQYETLRLRKDSTIINVSITLSPVFDMYGKLAAVSVIYRDITERKRAEERLRESEEKYRNIVETANEGIFIINNEAVITYANKKVTDMIGYSLEEGIGRPVWEFISDESKALAKLSLESRQQGINESYELKLIRKDGLPLWVLINVKSLFDKDGRFMGSLSMFTDITERKEAERTLDKIQIARQKEIHHRIKNNLQVISSLLDLQAGKFNNKEHIRDSEVLEAFKESQDRVTSIALIHEELHEEEGKTTDTLNFPIYLQRLVKNLFRTYTLGNIDISLNLDLKENIFFDMDTAVPLGIIVNELVSNSLKHAFSGRNKGIIQIKLFSEEAGNEPNSKRKLSMEKLIKEKLAEEELAEEELAKEELAKERIPGKSTGYTLIVSDDGIGIPEEIDIKNPETLGLQLVNILVDQLDGKIKLEREHGTEFIINFSVEEKNN